MANGLNERIGRNKRVHNRQSRQRVATILDSVDDTDITGISDELAKGILSLLDEWLDDCERMSNEFLNVPIPKYTKMAADLRDAVLKMRKYRNTIQFSNQSWWAFGMMNAVHAATILERLNQDVTRICKENPYLATLKRIEKMEEKRNERCLWLSTAMQNLGITQTDVERSRNDRKRLYDGYEEEFGSARKTFIKDLKTMGLSFV